MNSFVYLRNLKTFPHRIKLYPKGYCAYLILSNEHENGFSYHVPKRQFSLQETIDSLVKTQSGIFKTVSESSPIEYLQNFLVNTHDLTGLPWWTTIVCTTIFLRTVITLPLAIYQNYILAKIENLNMEMPEIANELKKEVAHAIKLYNWDEKTAKYHYKRSLKKQWNNLIIRDNCHPVKSTILLWFQIPMWLCYSVALRNFVYMLPNSDAQAQLTFLELTVGGFGWIPNLTEVDSSWILPITFGLANIAIIELQSLSKVRVPSKYQRVLTNVFRGFAIFMIPVSASVPSCLTLYWTTSSVYGLMQNIILLSPRLKRMCRIPQTPSELDKPYRHVLAGIRMKLNIEIRNKSS